MRSEIVKLRVSQKPNAEFDRWPTRIRAGVLKAGAVQTVGRSGSKAEQTILERNVLNCEVKSRES